ncbi:Alpha/Beta hydrolase protein [Kockovaella imperatae]|uniref:Alpha/Beta hydrolase protein n=1 Tax=Kockovaella imperatae TaxID=4999 RepID=A0A1Y1UDZ3_9TREE|nr:Alpha/Beta hydrolase protein [Kockovaella imperatae]ORX36261.1 Alpha/Beta hydrolase protein [Kockovaella imperatae]
MSEPSYTGFIPFETSRGHSSTFYKVFGDLTSGVIPVIILHGGPGAGHEYLLPYTVLWTDYGIPVILYDEVGCGQSSHMHEQDGDKTFWLPQLFLDELANLIKHFKLDRYHLLGQSFGGMMAAEYATTQPKGLRRLVLASALASSESGSKGYWLEAELLPKEDQEAIREAVDSGDYDSEGYKTAMDHYRRTFMCRTTNFPPPELIPAFKNISESTTWKTMNGDSLFDKSKGSMTSWDIIAGLHKIQAPTLVYNGEFDTSHDVTTVPFFERIPKVRWITFPDAGHMLHLETEERRKKVMKLVGEFLSQGQ